MFRTYHQVESSGNVLGIIKPKITDVLPFCFEIENIISKIAIMGYILPALVVLNETYTKRACYSLPSMHVLDLFMFDTSILGLLTFDLSMCVLLMIIVVGVIERFQFLIFTRHVFTHDDIQNHAMLP